MTYDQEQHAQVDVYGVYEDDVYCEICGMTDCGIDHRSERKDAEFIERESMREAGVNPDTWEIHYAPARYGGLPMPSLMQTCGSMHDARKQVRKYMRRTHNPRIMYDIVGPRERWARKLGFVPKELATFRKGA
jgi:hypothetical protein